MDFTKGIIEKIEHEKIEPLPGWWFHVQYGFFWVLFVIALFLGSLAFSLILYFIFEGDILLAKNPLSHFLEMLPWLWVSSFVVLFILGYWGLKHTHSGYKIPVLGFLFGNIIISFVLGVGWYIAGIPDGIDTHASRFVPIHHPLEKRKEMMWNMVEQGMLGGVVVRTTEEGFILKGPNGNDWEVFVSHDMIAVLRKGQKVKIRGVKLEGRKFRADEVLPWRRGENFPVR